MVPLLAEFNANKTQHRPISEVMTGDYAIIRTLDLERAILGVMTRYEEGWAHGIIVLPQASDRKHHIRLTFSRSGSTLVLPVSVEAALELQTKYKLILDSQ